MRELRTNSLTILAVFLVSLCGMSMIPETHNRPESLMLVAHTSRILSHTLQTYLVPPYTSHR
ncbi:hypothetical protein M404DRAFT_32984, partial [Pisolithus tinctorius Marx 270]